MFQINAKGKRAEILLYDNIGEGLFGGISAQGFMDELKGHASVNAIDLRLNSGGGDVFDGLAIHNALVRHPARVTTHVDGLAASIASVIAMAGDEIRMADNAMMMIHDPWTWAMGSAEELRKQAGTLDKIRDTLLATYTGRTGADQAEISGMMTAETWMDAQEAVSRGFADAVTEPMAQAAHVNMQAFNYQHTPERLKLRGSPLMDDYRRKIETLENRRALL